MEAAVISAEKFTTIGDGDVSIAQYVENFSGELSSPSVWAYMILKLSPTVQIKLVIFLSSR
jgi:hypothetical protein